LASKRHCTMSFALSILWSKFKSVGEHENAEIAFVLLHREREREREREEELEEEEAAKRGAAVRIDYDDDSSCKFLSLTARNITSVC
jgi:hypothetical protein